MTNIFSMHEIIESITKFNLIKNEEILSKLYNIISNQIQRQCKIKSRWRRRTKHKHCL
jgi:hypothetical protein